MKPIQTDLWPLPTERFSYHPRAKSLARFRRPCCPA